jgi:hypothetical protein
VRRRQDASGAHLCRRRRELLATALAERAKVGLGCPTLEPSGRAPEWCLAREAQHRPAALREPSAMPVRVGFSVGLGLSLKTKLKTLASIEQLLA